MRKGRPFYRATFHNLLSYKAHPLAYKQRRNYKWWKENWPWNINGGKVEGRMKLEGRVEAESGAKKYWRFCSLWGQNEELCLSRGCEVELRRFFFTLELEIFRTSFYINATTLILTSLYHLCNPYN